MVQRSNRAFLRNAILSSASATVIARLASAGASLVVIPIGLNYFGDRRFGVWLTVASFTQIAALSDFGFGNSLMTAISNEKGPRSIDTQAWVSAGLALLSLAAILIAIIAVGLAITVDWAALLRTELTGEVQAILALLAASIVLGLPLSVTEKTQWGLQLGYIPSLWQILGSLITLAAVIAATALKGSLAQFGAAILIPPMLVALINGILMFRRWWPTLRPTLRSVTWPNVRDLATMGGYFFVIQAISGIAFASDNLIVSARLGPDAVPSLAVPAKLFALVVMVSTTALLPLWPAYGMAIAQGDRAWVTKSFRLSLLIGASLSAVGAATIWLAGPSFIRWWVGPQFVIVEGLLPGLAAWTALSTLGTTVAMLLNAARVFRFQLLTGSAMAVTMVALKYWGAGSVGIRAIPWAATVSYGLIVFIPSLLYAHRWLASGFPTKAAGSTVP